MWLTPCTLVLLYNLETACMSVISFILMIIFLSQIRDLRISGGSFYFILFCFLNKLLGHKSHFSSGQSSPPLHTPLDSEPGLGPALCRVASDSLQGCQTNSQFLTKGLISRTTLDTYKEIQKIRSPTKHICSAVTVMVTCCVAWSRDLFFSSPAGAKDHFWDKGWGSKRHAATRVNLKNCRLYIIHYRLDSCLFRLFSTCDLTDTPHWTSLMCSLTPGDTFLEMEFLGQKSCTLRVVYISSTDGSDVDFHCNHVQSVIWATEYSLIGYALWLAMQDG